MVSNMLRPPDFLIYRYLLGLGRPRTSAYTYLCDLTALKGKIYVVGPRFELRTASFQGEYSVYYAVKSSSLQMDLIFSAFVGS